MFLALVQHCAPAVDPRTAHALVHVESSLNPFAIGIVGGVLERQPRGRAAAVATARALQAQGWNFSVGLAQINVGNFDRLGLSIDTAFEPCPNLKAMQAVLTECFERAAGSRHTPTSAQRALRRSLSCYYSGNFDIGFEYGYVLRVVTAARVQARHSTIAKEAP